MSFRHLYVHVPFCARRCSYCDFAIAVRKRTPVDDYVRAIEQEVAMRLEHTTVPPLETLYLGGGTPSRLGTAGVARLVGRLLERFGGEPGIEVTLEANPDDIATGTVRAWREAGINRVSLGVQSFSPEVLAWMHRTHGVDDVHRAARLLGDEGMANWSLDLIYALPPEIERDWSRDLATAVSLAPTHISAYGLTVEAGTPLARWRSRGSVTEADEERYEREFLDAHATLGAAGYEHYEVSNFARPGWRSRHNSSYWRDVPYLGLGPGAHGFDGRVRRWNEREYARWRERLGRGEDPLGGEESLTEEERDLERLYVGLRTDAGIVPTPRDEDMLDRWTAAGWGESRDGRYRLLAAGWLRLDALVTALTEHRSRL